MRHEEWAAKLNEQRQAEHKPFLSKTQGDEVRIFSSGLKKSLANRNNDQFQNIKIVSTYISIHELACAQTNQRVAGGLRLSS